MALTFARMLALFGALCCVSVLIGARQLPWAQLFSWSDDAWLTVTASRLPRLAALILAGVGLAICGAVSYTHLTLPTILLV
mgnify:CR=1 FL=1